MKLHRTVACLAFIVIGSMSNSAAAETALSRCLQGVVEASDPVLLLDDDNQVIFSSEVTNLGETALASLDVRTTVRTEGRAVPWARDDSRWQLSIPGGIEPGETREIKFSEVTDGNWIEPLVADLAIVGVNGPDGENIVSGGACVAPQEAPGPLLAAIQSCWVVPAGHPSADVSSTLLVKITDGRVVSSSIVTKEVSGGDGSAQETAYHSARSAILRCEGSGYGVEDGSYEITFDSR